MISIKVLIFCFVLVAVCNGNRKDGRGKFMKTLEECREQNGFTENIRQEMKKQYPDGVFKPDSVPKEYLCSMKCLDEKLEILKDGKYEVQNMNNSGPLMRSLKTPEKYLKCLEDLEGIKECEDYRKKVKCDNDFGDTYVRECAVKFNMDEHIFLDGHRETRSEKNKDMQCFRKCIYESKGILGKDGKIVVEKAQDDTRLMWGVKNKDQFFNCLKSLEIKECEDLSKIFECKKN